MAARVRPRPPKLALQLPSVYAEYGKFEFVTWVWSGSGARLHSPDPGVDLPFRSRSGLSTVTANGESWHLYTIVLEGTIVQAAQRASGRESLARDAISALIVPALAMFAVLAALLALALRRALTPITALKLQLRLLERAGDETQRKAALDELTAGVARAQHLVE